MQYGLSAVPLMLQVCCHLCLGRHHVALSRREMFVSQMTFDPGYRHSLIEQSLGKGMPQGVRCGTSQIL